MSDNSDTDSDGFDYETEKTNDDNMNLIRLNNLNNTIEIKTKLKPNENAYLKIDNQEYKNIGLQIDSISNDSKDKSDSSTNTKSKILDSIEWNFNNMLNNNSKLNSIIDQYTENTEINDSENYIDIIDSNKLWDIIDKNNRFKYNDDSNYDDLSLESESLSNIVRNTINDTKSVFLEENTNNIKSYRDNHNVTHSEIFKKIMNSESPDNFDLVESYNFNSFKKQEKREKREEQEKQEKQDKLDILYKQDSESSYYSSSDCDTELEKKNSISNQDISSISDNMSIIDTYCMSEIPNKSKKNIQQTTSTIEECKKNKLISSSDSYNNVFNNYAFNLNKKKSSNESNKYDLDESNKYDLDESNKYDQYESNKYNYVESPKFNQIGIKEEEKYSQELINDEEDVELEDNTGASKKINTNIFLLMRR